MFRARKLQGSSDACLGWMLKTGSGNGPLDKLREAIATSGVPADEATTTVQDLPPGEPNFPKVRAARAECQNPTTRAHASARLPAPLHSASPQRATCLPAGPRLVLICLPRTHTLSQFFVLNEKRRLLQIFGTEEEFFEGQRARFTIDSVRASARVSALPVSPLCPCLLSDRLPLLSS